MTRSRNGLSVAETGNSIILGGMDKLMSMGNAKYMFLFILGEFHDG